MVRHFDVDDPRVPQKQWVKVGVFPFGKAHDAGKPATRFSAYTTWYNPEWKGCCEHQVLAINGTEAKKLAIQEHKEHCQIQQ